MADCKLIPRSLAECDIFILMLSPHFCNLRLVIHCFKDILSPKAPSIEVENTQKSNVEVLDALKVVVSKEEEMSRQRVDELEKKTGELHDEKRKVKNNSMQVQT